MEGTVRFGVDRPRRSALPLPFARNEKEGEGVGLVVAVGGEIGWSSADDALGCGYVRFGCFKEVVGFGFLNASRLEQVRHDLS